MLFRNIQPSNAVGVKKRLFSKQVEFGGRRKVEDLLELRHRAHLASPVENVDPFFVAIAGSPSK
jgi:hypothetical protein